MCIPTKVLAITLDAMGGGPRTWSGVIGTDPWSLWGPKQGWWSKPSKGKVDVCEYDLALGTDHDSSQSGLS